MDEVKPEDTMGRKILRVGQRGKDGWGYKGDDTTRARQNKRNKRTSSSDIVNQIRDCIENSKKVRHEGGRKRKKRKTRKRLGKKTRRRRNKGKTKRRHRRKKRTGRRRR